MKVTQLYRAPLDARASRDNPVFKASELFECGQCKIIHRDVTSAQNCCVCNVCHQPQDPIGGIPYHSHCFRVREEQQVRADIERAEKLKEWSGGVFHNDEFYSDIESFVDCWPQDKALPEWVFAAKAEPFLGVSYDDIEEQLCDNGYEDMRDDFAGTKELNDAIDQFNAANKAMTTYWEDRSRVVRVSRWCRSMVAIQ